MKIHKMKRYSFLLRLVAMISLTALIPLLLGSFSMLRKAEDNMESQLQLQEQKNAENFCAYFHEQLQFLTNLSKSICLDEAFTNDVLEQTVVSMLTAQKSLTRFLQNQTIAENVAFCSANSNYVIGDNYSYQKKYFHIITGLGEHETDILINAPSSAKDLFFSAFGRGNGTKTFLYYSVPVSEYRRFSRVIWKISYQNLNRGFLGEAFAGKYDLFILDADGRILLANGQNGTLFSDYLRENAAILPESSVFLLGGEQYRCTIKSDSSTGFSFVIIGDNQAITSNVSETYQSLERITIIMFIGAFMSVLATVYLSYRDIYHLAKMVDKNTDSPKAEDEIQRISDAFQSQERELEEQESTKLELEEQRELTEQLAWSSCLEHGETDQKALDIISHTGNCFFAAVLKEKNIEVLQNALRKIHKETWVMPCRYMDGLVTVFAIQKDDNDARVRCVDLLLLFCKETSKIGVGLSKTSPQEITRSLAEAISAYYSSRETSVIYFEQAASDYSIAEQYPSEQVMRFLQLVREGELKDALYELDEIIHDLKTKIIDYSYRQFICFDLAGKFIRLAEELNAPLSSKQIEEILHYEKTDRLREVFSVPAREICEKIHKQAGRKERAVFERALEIIDEQLSNPDFSQMVLAEQCGISVYSVSRLFRQFSQTGYREYVIDKRLELANRLLKVGGKTVSEIALEVGYRDASYFVRLYKKRYEKNPGL